MEVLPYIVTVNIYGNTIIDVLPYMVTQESMCYHIVKTVTIYGNTSKVCTVHSTDTVH